MTSKFPPFPVEYLRQILSYDIGTGIFRWIGSRHPANNGKIAGNTSKAAGRNVAKIGIGWEGSYKNYSAAALAWFYVHGIWPEFKVRCINADQSDLRIVNLELVVRKESYGPPDPNDVRVWNHKANLKVKFGITPERYGEMMLAQKGLCALCQKPETRMQNGRPTNLAVDHDHGNGKVRELLCFKCNIALGALNDDIEVMARAISYLRRHSGAETNVVPLRAVVGDDR